MQEVSTQWKQTLGCYEYADRPNLLPVSYVEVEYTVTDPEAQEDVVASDNGHISYSDVEETTSTADKTFAQFATFEQNRWVLDGTWTIKPAQITDDTGFISPNLCGEDCIFESRPIISLQFSQTFETLIPGITVTWSQTYNEMARDFIIRVYNGASLIKTFNVTDNTDIVSVVHEDIVGYDKIEIEIVEWCLPYCRARIEEIVVGIIVIFDKKKLIKYSHTSEADILALQLPNDTISFEITNVEEEWNPSNPDGMEKYLMERQEMHVRYGYKINGKNEWIKGGTFYMSEWNTPSNGISASFTAGSLIDFMNDKYTLPENKTITLYNLAVDALTQSDLPKHPDGTNKWSVGSALQNITVTLPEDFDATNAEVLQMCANASRCVICVDRDGDIRINPLSTTETDYLIDRFVSYKNAEYALSKPLKSVTVNDGMGTAENEESGEVQKIDNDLIQDATVANNVAVWVKSVLAGRKTLSGEYRPDPRLDALDEIVVKNKYATNSLVVTSVTYTYNGAFSGHYEGRIIE